MDRYVPIRDLFAREILDAGGRPAVEVEMLADKEVTGKASVSLTDPQRRRSRIGDAAAGQSGANRESAVVSSVVENINSDIAQELIGTNIFDQAEIDRTLRRLDGVPDKHILNRAATLAVSAAAARTAAAALNVPLYRYLGGTQAIRMPVPVVDVINGGRNEEDMPDFRGFMIVPSIEGTFQEQLNIHLDLRIQI